MAPSRLLTAGAALTVCLIWGAWFPITRLGLTTGAIQPIDMVVLRFSAGAIVFLPIVLKHGLKAGKAGWGGTGLILATLSGPFALFVGLGASHAPAAHAAIFIPGTFPAIVFVLGLLLFKDPPTLRRWLGLAAVMAGVALVGWAALRSGGGSLEGYLYFHDCAWMWAAYTVTVRISGLSAAHALAVTHVGAAAIYGPIWLLLGGGGLFDLPLAGLAFQVGYHGVLNGLVAMFLYNFAIQRLGASQAAVFAALVPCFAALTAWPILGEPIGWEEGLALVAVAIGVVLISGAPPAGLRRPEGHRRQN